MIRGAKGGGLAGAARHREEKRHASVWLAACRHCGVPKSWCAPNGCIMGVKWVHNERLMVA